MYYHGSKEPEENKKARIVDKYFEIKFYWKKYRNPYCDALNWQYEYGDILCEVFGWGTDKSVVRKVAKFEIGGKEFANKLWKSFKTAVEEGNLLDTIYDNVWKAEEFNANAVYYDEEAIEEVVKDRVFGKK